jgi:hypothetical protein
VGGDLTLDVLLVAALEDLEDVVGWRETPYDFIKYIDQILGHKLGMLYNIHNIFLLSKLLPKPLINRLVNNAQRLLLHIPGLLPEL